MRSIGLPASAPGRQSTEQAPGPRGSPQDPQPPEGDGVSDRPLLPPADDETAKTDSSLRRSRLSQAGQAGRESPEVKCSKAFPQARHTYSKSGIGTG
jgi:hypothetical protein